jgi:hypothetical protein
MKAASKTRNGQMPSPSPRRKRKTSLLDLEERPSVNVSASRSNSLRLINALLKLLSADEAEAVDTAVTEAVAMDLPVVAEAEVKVDSVEDVVRAEEAGVDVAAIEAVAVLLEAAPETLPSTPRTRAPSPAWDHRSPANKSHMVFSVVRTLNDASLRTNDRAKSVNLCDGCEWGILCKPNGTDGTAKVYGG